VGQLALAQVDIAPFEVAVFDLDRHLLVLAIQGMAGAIAHAMQAAVADAALQQRIRFQFGVGQEHFETLARAELGGQEHLGPAQFAQTCGRGRDAHVQNDIRRHFALGDRRTVRRGLMGQEGVAAGRHNGFVAVGLNELARHAHGIAERAVDPGAVAVDPVRRPVGIFADALVRAFQDASGQHDDRFRLRIDVERMCLGRRLHQARQRRDTDQVGARFAGNFFDHFTG